MSEVVLSYDPLGRIVNITRYGASTYYARFWYYKNDQLSGVQYGNGLMGNYTYDKLGRVSQIKDLGLSALLSLNYAYNVTGTVASVTGYNTNNSNVYTVNEQYRYDPLHRLVNSNVQTGTTSNTLSYSYDAVGNRLSQNVDSVLSNYSVDQTNNELKNSTTTGGSVRYGYDLNGNLVSQNVTSPSTNWTYTWDVPGNLLKVSNGGGVQGYHAYDGLGRRLESQEGSSTTFYAYHGTDAFYELSGSTSTDYIYAGNLKITKIVAGYATGYYCVDALGSTRLVTDRYGSVIFSDNYQPYGQNNGTPTGSETYRFTDKPWSTASQLQYNYRRWYDSSTGRFISQDPRHGKASYPQSLNPYIYVLDLPTLLKDPTGMYIAPSFTCIDACARQSVSESAGGVSLYNAWNGLSPEEKQVFWIGVGVVAMVATGGAAAPLVLAIGLATGAAFVGGYAAYSYATGQQMTLSGTLTAFSIGFAVGTIAGGVASSGGLLGDLGAASKSVEFAPANPATDFPGGVAKVLGHMPQGVDQEEWLSGVWDLANNPVPETTTINPGGGVRVHGLIDDYMVRVVIGRWGRIINAFPVEALNP